MAMPDFKGDWKMHIVFWATMSPAKNGVLFYLLKKKGEMDPGKQLEVSAT